VEVRWRSLFRSTSLGKRCTSYNAPSTSGKRAANRRSLRNFLPRSSPFLAFKSPEIAWGRNLDCMAGVLMGFHRSTFFQAEHRIQFRSLPMRLLGFSNHENGDPRQEISKWSTVCRKFSRGGWSVVRNASLAKGGTSEKRASPHLYKVPTRSNKVSPRTLQTALVYHLSVQR
jgi:hypothetical protein